MAGGRRGLLAWRKAMISLSRLPLTQTRTLLRMAQRIPPITGLNEALASVESPVDLVHGFNISWEHTLLAAWQYAGARGLPYVVTPFAHLGEAEGDRIDLNTTMDHQQRLMSDADALMTLTSIEADGLRQRGASPARVSVIGAGLDPLPPASDGQRARMRLGLTRPFVLFIGRASFDKGALHAAQAILALHRQGVEINLVLVGLISEEFERFLNGLTAEEKQIIHPAGILDETTKHGLLNEAEMLMLPSRTDSFGIVLLEAWAHGKPVIAARAGGIPGVVDEGENGFLVNFGDVQSMTEAVRLLLVDQSLRQRMGEAGRSKVIAQYNWEQITDRVLDVYETVLRHL
jgi:glycosyltransferase involved in cell wall biosynthesis